jgi:hypothetical protein
MWQGSRINYKETKIGIDFLEVDKNGMGMWLGENNAYTFGYRGKSLKTSTSKTEEMGWAYYDVRRWSEWARWPVYCDF